MIDNNILFGSGCGIYLNETREVNDKDDPLIVSIIREIFNLPEFKQFQKNTCFRVATKDILSVHGPNITLSFMASAWHIGNDLDKNCVVFRKTYKDYFRIDNYDYGKYLIKHELRHFQETPFRYHDFDITDAGWSPPGRIGLFKEEAEEILTNYTLLFVFRNSPEIGQMLDLVLNNGMQYLNNHLDFISKKSRQMRKKQAIEKLRDFYYVYNPI